MWRAIMEGLDRRLGWREARARVMADAKRLQPPNAGWGVTLGVMALAALALEMLSGVVLAFHYRATPEAAHASVAQIRDLVPLGWLWLSIHAWGTHTLVALALIHAARVFVKGGHKRPRELTWVAGAVTLFAVLGLSITGHLLPWTNEADWATVVRLGHVNEAPFIGGLASRFLRGGEEVGASTLTRFYILHVAILPAVLAAILCLHLRLVKRLGLAPAVATDEEDAKGHAACAEGGEPWFPNHLLRAAAAATVAAGVLITVAAMFPPEPGARASAVTPPGLRPEWVFLALFQYLKYWPAKIMGLSGQTVGQFFAMLAVGAFALLPFLDRSPERRAGRRKVAIALFALAALVWGSLTFLGAVSGRNIDAFGKTWRFNDRGGLK
ncbi:MAG: cytochrome b N-terminal domain-containing protein [Planctomycetes bacterium]|nr:cytochrome b N-terminal domain-containing protein [Planctomycetota bacterium]